MSIVTMKNKTRAIKNSRTGPKKNIYRNRYFCGSGVAQNGTSNNNSFGYSAYNKKLIRGRTSCDKAKTINVVKSRVNKRLTSERYIINKKMSVIRKILCDNKTAGITKKSAKQKYLCKKTTQPVSGRYTTSLGGRRPTLKQRILNSCNCTKDLTAYGSTKYEGAGYASSASSRLERIVGTTVCEDIKYQNAKDQRC